jgi:hypothetical protein
MSPLPFIIGCRGPHNNDKKCSVWSGLFYCAKWCEVCYIVYFRTLRGIPLEDIKKMMQTTKFKKYLIGIMNGEVWKLRSTFWYYLSVFENGSSSYDIYIYIFSWKIYSCPISPYRFIHAGTLSTLRAEMHKVSAISCRDYLIQEQARMPDFDLLQCPFLIDTSFTSTNEVSEKKNAKRAPASIFPNTILLISQCQKRSGMISTSNLHK